MLPPSLSLCVCGWVCGPKNMYPYQKCQIVLIFADNTCFSEDQTTLSQCIIISSCPVAIEGLKKGIYHKTCGYQGLIPFVCCPTSGISPVNPITIKNIMTTTTTTTTKPINTESVTKKPGNRYKSGDLSWESKKFYMVSNLILCVCCCCNLNWI